MITCTREEITKSRTNARKLFLVVGIDRTSEIAVAQHVDKANCNTPYSRPIRCDMICAANEIAH